MSKYEKDIKELIEQMNRQQGAYSPSLQPSATPTMPNIQTPNMKGNFQGNPDQSPHLMEGNPNVQGPDQTPPDAVNSVRPMGSNIGDKPPAPKTLSSAEGACPQCGMIHPPIPQGQKCPMANVKIKNEKGEEKVIDVNKFMAQLKNIIVSQSEHRGIKDIEKMFKNIIVEVTKYLEGYKE